MKSFEETDSTALSFWSRLGVDESGIPEHFPVPVDKFGNGPASEDEAVEVVCWCGEGTSCPLHIALLGASML